MPIITSATNLIQGTFPCMLGLWHGVCRYYISSQPVSFSLGEAISAVGLIFAVYQLKKISWELRLQMRGWLGDLFWIFGTLGVLCILGSVFVANLPLGLIPEPFSLPLFYEVLGFIFFLLSPMSLFWVGYRRKKFFNAFNAERFYVVTLHNIVRREPERLEAVIDILFDNLPRLVRALSGVCEKPKTLKGKIVYRFHLITDRILGAKRVKERESWASAIFNVVLSEKRVADYIVTQRMDFVGRLFYCLKNSHYTIAYVQGGVGKILQQLLQNENSFLYNQLDYDGLSYVASLYKLIFEDYDLVLAHKPFRLGLREHIAGVYDSASVTVFLKAFEASLKTYLSNKRECIDNYPLLQAFDTLERYTEGLCRSINTSATFEETQSDLRSISHFYGHTFPNLFEEARRKKLLYELDVRLKDFDGPEGLSEAYAKSLYKFAESISTFDQKKEQECSISHYVDEAWHIFIFGNDFPEIRDAVLKLVWDQITEKNIKGWFPCIIKIYLLVLPWWDINPRTYWMGTEMKRMAGLLDTLKPQFLKKAKMANRTTLMEDVFLPKCVKFFKKENKIHYINQFNELIKII